MPYDPELAARIRDLLDGTDALVEKKMFGGIGWTVGGHMAVGAESHGNLMIRCSPDDFRPFIAEPGADGMRRGETLMTGWIIVEAGAVASQDELIRWVDRGRSYAQSLPPKKK